MACAVSGRFPEPGRRPPGFTGTGRAAGDGLCGSIVPASSTVPLSVTFPRNESQPETPPRISAATVMILRTIDDGGPAVTGRGERLSGQEFAGPVSHGSGWSTLPNFLITCKLIHGCGMERHPAAGAFFLRSKLSGRAKTQSPLTPAAAPRRGRLPPARPRC